ncbi:MULTISPECIES: signal peptidase II [unclassified Sphingomonas]|jgi:signal peptidase II|uniref:signal peptidase II n=1 Tax=unclassified Sphingomonas TaxID=196159 RepID=UPI0006F3CA9D|nr:signal peptidase II [Sphingomonas sp. Leaf20]KQM73627.1 signal peptidase II [Sphingomonas sp. Leaf20]
MRNLPKAGFAAAIVLFLADQLSKWAVTKPLGIDSLGDARTITSFFDLRFVPNIGISLGLLPADGHLTRWALVLLTGAISVGVAVWMTREKNPADQIALGFVLGGAVGNILDRIRLGYVVDFADLHIGEWRPFLVFNVADAAITVGVLVLLVRALLVREKPPVENSHA